MAYRPPEVLDNFREGLAAGQEAGRSRDFVYALGFAIGFLWAAFSHRAPAEENEFARAARMA
jgi:hypothetical protein